MLNKFQILLSGTSGGPRWDAAALFIARGFGSGLLPKAPGTWGSVAAMLAAALVFMPLPVWLRLLLLVPLTLAGVWAAARAEILLGRHDASEIVVDEWLGLWLTYAAFPSLGWLDLLAGFLLFRFFDIIKPGPIGTLQHLPGGWGVMADDLAAGVAAGVLLALMRALS
ncbi:phosphatidylglycerophosphatase A family protein [Megalodesulfovibrio gigas]|uniref:phosphatidylglycerophosphatase A family protein n=1 Tax=Megalodesulfovibrio gigas TaxID=879 RepID=UPI0004180D2C|nr:phosphatidylglycerophosphatase A [Megalodesulfovibrio gigas]